ncbi:MAG: glycosyl transferase [Pseudomonadota bacterium]|nr:glycosyl transferase [Pseudomonadota bacterium]
MSQDPVSSAASPRVSPSGRAALPRAAAALGEAGRRAGAWAAESRPRQAAALLLLCLALYLPGIAALPVTDRDEARFAQATKQMLVSGDLIDIRFQDEPRWKKPVGIYWMQAAAVKAVGGPEDTGIWAWRIPSLIGATLAVFATLWALSPLIGGPAAFLAAGMTAAAMALAGEANIAKTDAMLLGLTATMMGAWIRLLSGAGFGLRRDVWFAEIPAEHFPARGDPTPDRAALRAALWGAMGLAVLVKGPIAPLVLALTLAVTALATGSLRGLACMGWRGFGPALFAALVLPWLVAIHIASDGGFWAEAVGRDLLGKVAGGQEKHGAPPGTYLAVVWGVLWPWAPLLLLAAPAAWAARRRAWAALLLGWAIPFWLVLEATPTKLAHYLLPVIPPLAGLVAAWLVGGGAPRRGGSRAAAVLFGAVGAALAGACMVLPAAVGNFDLWAALLAVPALVFVTLGTVSLWRGLARDAVPAMLGATLLLYPAILQFALPALAWGFPSQAMARASAPFAACTGRPAASQSFREPSLVFLQGTDTAFLTETEAAETLRTAPGALVWVEDRRRDRLDAALGEAPPALTELARVDAFNPNRGKPTVLRLMGRAGDPALADCAAAKAATAGPDASPAASRP